MSRDRVPTIILLAILANALILTWALWSPVVAALGLAALAAGWGLLCWVALRGIEQELYRCRLELATIRPDEREQAVLRLASQAEILRRAEIIKREGVFLPEQDHGAALPDGYGLVQLPLR
jgi:hypothetical protein